MYFCPFCFESCISIKSLNAHCKLKHCIQLHSSFRCKQKLCPRTFSDIHSFFRHLSRTHSEENSIRNDKFSTNHNNVGVHDNVIIEDNMSKVTYNSPSEIIKISASCAINNSNISNITVEAFAESMAKTSASFVARLYSRPSLPRVFCQEIIDSIEVFLDNVKIIEKTYKAIELNPHPDLSSMFNILNNAFADFSSEYRTILYFKTLNSLIEPQEIYVGTSIDSKLTKTGRQIIVKNKKICILPLDKILKKFLELPGVYNNITSNIKKIKQSKMITSVLQSEIWHSIEQQYDNDMLPLILYFDEFEINNPLGSHRGLHKLGVVYCTVYGIGEEHASILENIFLVQLHNVIDHLQVGNKQIFANLINQINNLQTNGIIINIGNVKRKINFVLLHILGDNLGLHAIFGSTTSFNSNYSCRICLVDKTTRQKQIFENIELLRTAENYATDIIDQNMILPRNVSFIP